MNLKNETELKNLTNFSLSSNFGIFNERIDENNSKNEKQDIKYFQQTPLQKLILINFKALLNQYD